MQHLSHIAWVSSIRLALSALILEAAIGYPQFVYRAIGHPVTWMGAMLDFLERRLNRGSGGARRLLGVLTLILLLAATFFVSWVMTKLFSFGMIGWVLLVLVSSSLVAQRSLHAHVVAVAEALEKHGLEGGRKAVSMIVGRNPTALDEAGVARAAIESLAENFSDGIIAPAFWIAVAGLPGGALYKAANTADSMIGHRNVRYAAFGWAAARFDDVVNLPASRLAALFIVAAARLGGASAGGAWRALWRDAPRHRSPNAGWPEAAMAGALGLKLGGPRFYGDEIVDDAFMGTGRSEANAADIRQALLLYRIACVLSWGALLSILVIARF
jgi:adenosylcobinamide-phosphate synthase